MKTLLKVAAVVGLLLFVAAAGAAFFVWRGMQSAPDFYHREPLSGAERLAAIESFDRKVLNLQAALDLAYIHSLSEEAPDPGGFGTPQQPAGPIAVTFTGAELDTYFNKWLQDAGYEQRVARYMRNPRVGIEDGHVILAGQMEDFGAVVSLYFLPSLDEQGAVELTLTGVYAGRIPVPQAALGKFRDMAHQALSEDHPGLRREAAIGPDGTANKQAVLLAVQQQLETLVGGDPVKPLVAFLPLPTRGTVPAEVNELRVQGEELTLGVELMDRNEREQFIEDLKSGRFGSTR